MTDSITCTLFKGTLSDVFKIFYGLLASTAILILSIMLFNMEAHYVLPIFMGMVMVFAIFFVRFRFKKGNYLAVGTCEISDDSLNFYGINGDFFKKIPFSEIHSVKFKHVFAYDDKNKQIIFTLHNTEKWTMTTNPSGVEITERALKQFVNPDSDSLKKVPMYMHFVAVLLVSFYLFFIYLQLFEPDQVSLRNIIILITTLPVFIYYLKLRKEVKIGK